MIENGFRVDHVFIYVNLIIVTVFIVGALVNLFVTLRLMKAYEDLYIHVRKLERDVELRYEDIIKFICPKDLRKPNEKCKDCVSRKYKKECWTQHFIERLKGENENANCKK